MKFTTTLATLLSAEAALGARFTRQRREAAEKRALQRTSLPRIAADDSTVESLDLGNGTSANVEYSTNWAGAVLIGSVRLLPYRAGSVVLTQ